MFKELLALFECCKRRKNEEDELEIELVDMSKKQKNATEDVIITKIEIDPKNEIEILNDREK